MNKFTVVRVEAEHIGDLLSLLDPKEKATVTYIGEGQDKYTVEFSCPQILDGISFPHSFEFIGHNGEWIETANEFDKFIAAQT